MRLYGVLLEQYVGAQNTDFGFAGEQADANGLYNLRARYYDPALGTFLSRDPVIGAMGGPNVRFNPYLYAGGNPVNFVDPSGEIFWWLLPVLWFARGAIIDIGMQVLLEGRSLDNLDLGRAVLSGGIDALTSGVGSVAKGLGASTKLINRLDYVADTLLSAGADTAFGGQDFGDALVGNAVFGGIFRSAFHQGGRLLNWAAHTSPGQAIISRARQGISATVRGARRAAHYVNNQLLRAGRWYADHFDLNAVGSGPFPVLRRPQSSRKTVLELFSGPTSQIRRDVPGYENANIYNVEIADYVREGVQADATRLPFASNSVDEVFITNPYNVSLIYAGERDAFKWAYFTEVARVLKPEGRAIVSAQVSVSGGFVNRFARVWGEGTLRPELSELGFRVRRQDLSGSSPYGTLHPALQGQHFGRPDSPIPGPIPAEAMRSITLTWGG